MGYGFRVSARGRERGAVFAMKRAKSRSKAVLNLPQHRGRVRVLALQLGILALVGQFLLPVLYQASGRAAYDNAYADFVRAFGIEAPLCAGQIPEPPGAKDTGHKIPAHTLDQCPICASMSVLAGLLPSHDADLVLPPEIVTSHTIVADLSARARHRAAKFEPRAPSAMV
jgi:hypothetical protein